MEIRTLVNAGYNLWAEESSGVVEILQPIAVCYPMLSITLAELKPSMTASSDT
jgi:hypothetical protein